MGLPRTIRLYYSHFNLVFIILFGISWLMASSSSSSIARALMVPEDMSSAILIRVDQSGKGDYRKIQDAIDAVPPNTNDTKLYFIWVKPGNYSEKVVVSADKPFITLSGTLASNTILSWNDGQDILESPTLTVFASDFVCRLLTIQYTYKLLRVDNFYFWKNTYGASGKGVALRVAGDRAAFHGCMILSYQDTLLDDNGNHYFRNCYIEGATDFICGSASSLYEKCHLHSLSENNGSMTAQMRTSPWEKSGFAFLGCKITGKGSTFLGRPWGAFSRVVFAYTFMSSAVVPQGWNEWGDQSKRSTVYYGEYKCYGPGADHSERVSWSRGLSDDEAAPFLSKDFIGGKGWLRPPPRHFKSVSTISNIKPTKHH